jgi:hypothetical protein
MRVKVCTAVVRKPCVTCDVSCRILIFYLTDQQKLTIKLDCIDYVTVSVTNEQQCVG